VAFVETSDVQLGTVCVRVCVCVCVCVCVFVSERVTEIDMTCVHENFEFIRMEVYRTDGGECVM